MFSSFVNAYLCISIRIPPGSRRYVSRSGLLGYGTRDYRRALDCIKQWKHCSLDWTAVVRGSDNTKQRKRATESASIQSDQAKHSRTDNEDVDCLQLLPDVHIGSRYHLSANTFGVWISNPLMITDLFHGKRVCGGKKTKRYMRMAHRTLQGHLLQGEETFELEHKRDDSVWYRISSVSRPCHILSFIGYPLLFIQQTRFMSDSLHMMKVCLQETREVKYKR